MTARLSRLCAMIAGVVWSLALAVPAAAGSLQIAPLRIELTAERPVAAMTVTNGDDAEVAVQAEVLEWTQENGRDVYTPTRDVLVNPIIFRLPAQGAQIVRLGLQVSATATERAYRLFVQQLPREEAAGAGFRMQTLLRLAVPVFVPATAPRVEARWGWSAERSASGAPTLVLENAGSTHIQLTRLSLRSGDGASVLDTPLSLYVLAGRSAPVPVRLPVVPPGSASQAPQASLRIEASADTPQPLPAVALQVPHADAVPR